jgi:integrase
MAYVPESSGVKIAGAIRRWKSFLTFVGLEEATVDWRAVVAFIVLRCCPPVDAVVPEFVTRPLLPATAAGEIDCCLRAARLNVCGMTPFDKAFSDFRVSALLHNIKARSPRLKTAKRPILYSGVEAFWRKMKTIGSKTSIRDGFAAVVALTFATRARELLSMRTEDLDLIDIYDRTTGRLDRKALRITFREVKTRQSIFSTLDPFTVTSAHPLLMEAFTSFDDVVEFWPGATIFRSENGQNSPLSRDWLDRIAKAIDPRTTPHCFRVGCATELWSAGVDVQDIMAIGRWASLGAILYIIGSLERQADASDRMGRGELRFVSGELHKRIGTSFDIADKPVAPTARWATHLGNLAAEGVEPDWSD